MKQKEKEELLEVLQDINENLHAIHKNCKIIKKLFV